MHKFLQSEQVQTSYRWMKYIDCIDCFLSALFVAEDKINPRRQALSHNVRLQSLTMDQHKQSCIMVTPWW